MHVTSKKNSRKISTNTGVAALTTVMVIAIMIIAVIVSITSVASNELFISQGVAQSANALAYAEAGVRDALIRIARDKTYTCATTDCYSIDFVTSGCTNNTDCAKVTVSTGLGTTADPKVITSKGIASASTRRVQVTVLLDGGTTTAANQNGEITSAAWTELTN